MHLKTLIRNMFAWKLGVFARLIIRKYKPTIIMITGSVGKTSTKDAVAAALSGTYYLRKSDKSFNSDFGVPLTIIGTKNPWSNPFAWLRVFWHALTVLVFPNHYPKLLVLEVGADRPGDLAKILRIATPDMVVVTLLPSVPVHVEAYESPRAVREEEFVPALALSSGAPLIYSADDEFADKHSERVDAHRVTFGMKDGATVRLTDLRVWTEDGTSKGMEANVTIEGSTQKHIVRVEGSLGRAQLFAPAAALAAAISLGIPAEEALEYLAKKYVSPPGRGRLFSGIYGSLLIDDSYNSSPAAVEESLRSLELIPNITRKVAVLGDMLELGRYSSAEHARIGHIAKETIDILICVGPRARAIGEAAFEDGMPEADVLFFENSDAAANTSNGVPAIVQEGDVVLVKGSQGVRLERIVRALIANPGDASKLVRQESEWAKR